MLKSRLARSSAIEPGSGVKSIVRPSPSTTLQAPWRSESGKGAPPIRFASLRAARFGSRIATSRSTSGRSSAWSRTAPPTIHASSSPKSSSTRPRTLATPSGIDDHSSCAPRIRVDPAHQLVVDRPGHARVLLGEHAVAEDGHGRAHRLLAVDLDRERVHRDGADDAGRLPPDAHLRAGEGTGETIRIADRDDSDPRRLLRDEATAVAGALTSLEPLHLRQVAAPRKYGLEPIHRGPRRTARARTARRRSEPRRGGTTAGGG